jgi:hypothetical protein
MLEKKIIKMLAIPISGKRKNKNAEKIIPNII